jgi:hypothetical protein
MYYDIPIAPAILPKGASRYAYDRENRYRLPYPPGVGSRQPVDEPDRSETTKDNWHAKISGNTTVGGHSRQGRGGRKEPRHWVWSGGPSLWFSGEESQLHERLYLIAAVWVVGLLMGVLAGDQVLRVVGLVLGVVAGDQLLQVANLLLDGSWVTAGVSRR